MAQYAMTYQCGHAGSSNVTGAAEKRAVKLAELQAAFGSQPCPNCRAQAEIVAAREVGDEALVARLVHERNVRNGRKGARTLQQRYGYEAADRIAREHGFAHDLQR